MIRPRCKFPLLVVFAVLAILSLGGCRGTLFNGDASVSKPRLPVPLSRAAKADDGAGAAKRRPPPLLLSVPMAASPAPALPPVLTKVDSVPVVPSVSAKADGASRQPLPDQAMPLSASTPPSGYFIPSAMFGIPPRPAGPVRTEGGAPAPVPSEEAKPLVAAVRPAKLNTPTVDVVPSSRLVVGIYISPTTRAYFAAAGMDYVQTIVQPWESFLQQNDMEVVRVVASDALPSARLDVLILPSAVALNASERNGLARFREQGGNLLATWLNGVRNEFGQWLGFDFMQQVLDTAVTGTTAEDESDTFILPLADSPVTHQLPAGQRIWLERAADWYPLRLSGKHTGLHIMDWSRTHRPGKSSSVMTYDERESGRPSRVAVLGLPERLWQSVAVDDFNKILSDTLLWLARRPDAYVATWPQAAGPAVMLAFDAPDPLTEQDLSLFSVAESFGGKANYFLLSEHLESAPESVQALLKETHHEVAWLGDRFEEFKDQPLNKQSRRIAVMLKEAAKVGLPVTAGAGFHAPMESYDGETSRALADKGFAYQITDSGVTDSLLPVLAKGLEGRDFLLYPRSMVAINGLLSGGLSPDVAAQQYAAALRTHLDLGGLTVIPVMQGEVFASVRWKQLMQSGFSAVRGKPWLASGREIATWWKAYRRVSATVDLSVSPPLLTVNIAGEENLQQPVSLLLNLPAKARSLRLVQDNTDDKAFAPNLSTHDHWRQRLSLEGVLPGTYHWYLLPDSGVQSMGQAQR